MNAPSPCPSQVRGGGVRGRGSALVLQGKRTLGFCIRNMSAGWEWVGGGGGDCRTATVTHSPLMDDECLALLHHVFASRHAHAQRCNIDMYSVTPGPHESRWLPTVRSGGLTFAIVTMFM